MGQAGHRDNDVVGATVPGLSWRQPRAEQGCGDPRGMGNRGPQGHAGLWKHLSWHGHGYSRLQLCRVASP